MSALFDLLDFAPEAPQWATDCFYCQPDSTGYYDEAGHLHRHLPLTCRICLQMSPNRLLFEQGDGVNLGASWETGYLLCSSLSLKLNHLRYDTLNGHQPDARDIVALELGWIIAPDGTPIAPTRWPLAPASGELRGGAALQLD